MLRASLLSSNLKDGITLAHHAISSRSQLPILLNFLIQARESSIVISATDLEIGIEVTIAAKVEEEGEVSIPAKTFLDLISNITAEKITLEQKENTLHLTSDRIKTTFPTIAASEFPKLYEKKGNKVAEFKKEDFDREAGRVVFSSAGDIGRPALSGVLIRVGDKGKLTIVASDGYRLSLKKDFSDFSPKDPIEGDLLIPARVIKEVTGVRGGDKPISLFVSKESNQALFEIGDSVIVGRLIEAEYPDFQKIIPDDFSTRAVMDKNEAHSAVRACSVFAREAANIIKMRVEKGKIVFSASASSVGENEVEVEAQVEGEENEIAFNARYLLELLSTIESEQLAFEMTGPLNPGVFKQEGDKDYLHLIMPIRIQE